MLREPLPSQQPRGAAWAHSRPGSDSGFAPHLSGVQPLPSVESETTPCRRQGEWGVAEPVRCPSDDAQAYGILRSTDSRAEGRGTWALGNTPRPSPPTLRPAGPKHPCTPEHLP